MCRAAKLSLGTKKVKQYKTRKPKRWFNKDCQKARKLFKRSAKTSNKNPIHVSLNEERSEKLKEFKKICKEQQTKFWDKRNDELKESKGEKFWNIWKSCDENIRNKSPNFCDGSKC